MMKKNTFKSFILAVSLLATSTACAPRREVNILTKEGAWAKASVNPMMARQLERHRNPGKDSAIVHIKGDGDRISVYLFVRYPLPVADSHLPRFRRSAKEFQIPEDLVKIEYQQPSEHRMIEI